MKDESLAKAQSPDHKETAQREEVTSLREEIFATVNEIAEAEQQVTSGYQQLFGGVKSDNHERQCWRGIVWYANADLESSKADRMRLPFLLLMIVEEVWQFFGLWPAGDLSIFTDLRDYASSTGCSIEDALPAVAKIYQAGVQHLLTWLSAPQKEASLAEEAITFLMKHKSGVQVHWASNPDFDDTANEGYPFLWQVEDIHCPSAVGPLCQFIFNQIERYHRDEISLAQAAPVLKCKRPPCGRFMVPERAGRKEYCSDNCRARHRLEFQTVSGEQRDYMWLHRLEWSKKDEVGYKLMMPKVVKRLSVIEKKWPKLAKRAGSLLERANDPSVQLARSVWELSNDPSAQKAISAGLEGDPSVQKARSLLENVDDPTVREARRLLQGAYKQLDQWEVKHAHKGSQRARHLRTRPRQ